MTRISNPQLARLLEAVRDDTFAERIQLFEQVGQGGMGTVYRAQCRADGRWIAVKELDPERQVDVERFVREAQLLERLDHPGIVRFVEHGAMNEGRHYLAMEWLEGETLASLLRRGPPSLDVSLRCVREVAEALAHAHANDVVHRDIKPSNIMLCSSPKPRTVLLDLGIARRVEADAETLTASGQIIGTPGYFAPEQLTLGAEIDGRTDVFALGCVLYEMLSGEAAFGSRPLVNALVDVMTAEPPPLTTAAPDTPPRLGSLVGAMLVKVAAERPTAQAVADELAAIEAAWLAADAEALSQPSKLASMQRALADTVAMEVTTRDGIVGEVQAAIPTRRSPRLAVMAVLALGLAGLGAFLAFGGVAETNTATALEPAACERDRREGCAARCAAGEAEACWRHGEALAHGIHGYARDREEGYAVLAQSCDAGVGRACTLAATILRLESASRPVEEWREELRQILQRGCDLKHGNACRRMALQLFNGEVLTGDPQSAFAFADRGCELGDNYSCRLLAGWHGDAGHKDLQRQTLLRACRRHDETACAQGAALDASPAP